MNNTNKVEFRLCFPENVFKVNDIIDIQQNLGKPLRTLWRGFNFIGLTLEYSFKITAEPESKGDMWEYPVELYQYTYKFLGITVLTITYK
tara:strand:+ start:507 stop:776 length:270 start_codon:yes stop_codon:yes gene_type:complete